MKNILVLDAQLRASLAIIRSLGKRNMTITAGSETTVAMGLYSKYCSKKLRYPNPRTNPDAFISYLQTILEKNTYDCIFPTHTYTTFLLSKHKKMLSKYTTIPLPDFNVFINAYDKEKLLKIALKHGIPCPKTYFCSDIHDIIDTVDYPVVVKAAKRHGVGIAICNSSKELREKYMHMKSKYGPCIVQEYIPNGGELGVYTLFSTQSEPLALTVQKRIRSLHPYGGVGTLKETVQNDTLVTMAFDLLKILKWSGVAMIEFRFDPRDGTPKLIEVNPRFWGSLELSILAGANFPYLVYRMIMEKNMPSNLSFKQGVQCRWLLGDIAWFLCSPHKMKNLRTFVRFNIHDDIFSRNDLKPMIMSVLMPAWNSFDEEPRDDDIDTL